MYDPKVGRWLSEDPIGFRADEANLSRYVGNSPLLYLDPSGLVEMALIGGGLQVTVTPERTGIFLAAEIAPTTTDVELFKAKKSVDLVLHTWVEWDIKKAKTASVVNNAFPDVWRDTRDFWYLLHKGDMRFIEGENFVKGVEYLSFVSLVQGDLYRGAATNSPEIRRNPGLKRELVQFATCGTVKFRIEAKLFVEKDVLGTSVSSPTKDMPGGPSGPFLWLYHHLSNNRIEQAPAAWAAESYWSTTFDGEIHWKWEQDKAVITVSGNAPKSSTALGDPTDVDATLWLPKDGKWVETRKGAFAK
jgi:hypothetical protein